MTLNREVQCRYLFLTLPDIPRIWNSQSISELQMSDQTDQFNRLLQPRTQIRYKSLIGRLPFSDSDVTLRKLAARPAKRKIKVGRHGRNPNTRKLFINILLTISEQNGGRFIINLKLFHIDVINSQMVCQYFHRVCSQWNFPVHLYIILANTYTCNIFIL